MTVTYINDTTLSDYKILIAVKNICKHKWLLIKLQYFATDIEIINMIYKQRTWRNLDLQFQTPVKIYIWLFTPQTWRSRMPCHYNFSPQRDILNWLDWNLIIATFREEYFVPLIVPGRTSNFSTWFIKVPKPNKANLRDKISWTK